MQNEYDNYYQTENLFGKSYPELIEFYSNIPVKAKLLDIGCGQGRDSISLAKLGFEVTGIDNSEVGINQLNSIAKAQDLSLIGLVEDLYTYSKFDQFDHLLLNSMFHFGKKERDKEVQFINRIISESKEGTFINICIQKVGKKLEILNSIFSQRSDVELTSSTELIYKYVDQESNHSSETIYEMVVVKKIKL